MHINHCIPSDYRTENFILKKKKIRSSRGTFYFPIKRNLIFSSCSSLIVKCCSLAAVLIFFFSPLINFKNCVKDYLFPLNAKIESSKRLGRQFSNGAIGHTGNIVGGVEQSTISGTTTSPDETHTKNLGKLVNGGGRLEEQPSLRHAFGEELLPEGREQWE